MTELTETWRVDLAKHQDAEGVDLLSIRANLALTPLERFRAHDRARAGILRLQDAARRTREARRSGREDRG